MKSQHTPITLALVDDHNLFRKGLISLLAETESIRVLFEASNGSELLERLAEGNHPQVILLDISMPVMDGVATLEHLVAHYPAIKVLMLTMNQDDAMILHIMKMGAHGYLLKETNPTELENAIHSVVETGFYFSELVSRALLGKLLKVDRLKPTFHGAVQLTDREMEVLDLVCQGLTNTEIAEKLFVSPRTVEGHRKNTMEKMGVRNTVAMVVYAIKKGWIDLDN
jgi:two-component system, NarL family, response regulator DegU